MGVRLDVAPSLYSTCFRLQSIGVEPTATVMQVAALTHQSCLGKMRNNRRHEQNCSGEANNSLRVLFHLLGANPKTKPQGSMLAFLSRQIEKAKCSASHRSIPRPTWRCQRTRARQVNLVISRSFSGCPWCNSGRRSLRFHWERSDGSIGSVLNKIITWLRHRH